MKQSNESEGYQKLKRDLLTLGPVCDGSLTESFQECGKPSCRCHKAKRYRHGPYYVWTRKVNGKTVTQQVPKEKLSDCRQWIQNNRRLNEIIRTLRDLTWRTALRNR